jgi:hypothetical protein
MISGDYSKAPPFIFESLPYTTYSKNIISSNKILPDLKSKGQCAHLGLHEKLHVDCRS